MDSQTQYTFPSPQMLHLLIVEDDPLDAELMVAVLKRAGYPMRFDVVSAPEAYERCLSQNRYDLILSDHNLRTWLGTDALHILRQSQREIPFVVVTASLGDEAAVDYVKQGAADYVLKHRLERLPAVVGRALREKQASKERARLQELILCAKREWELTFDTVPDPVMILDDQHRIRRANRAAARLLGTEFSQLIGQFCYTVVHGLNEPHPDCPYKLLLETGEEVRRDVVEPRWGKVFDVTASPLRDASGAPKGCIHVMRDITDRRQRQEALRQSEERYRLLVENAVFGIYLSTPSGDLLDVNPALVNMLGYSSSDELRAVNLETHIYRGPSVRATLLAEVNEKGHLEGAEVEWLRKDGTPILVRLSGRAVRDVHGQVETYETIAEDVTERRALEKQVAALQKFEAIGKLAGGIAHDFNNVIGAIMGWAELGQELVPQDSSLGGYFLKIYSQAKRAAGLTSQLLTFARRQILDARNLEVNETVREVIKFLESLIGENIEVKLVLAPDLPIVCADPAQLGQVLMNLCLNARDAMPQGGQLRIETQATEITEHYCHSHAEARPGHYVVLNVTDTGVGMDAATLEHIFEPFFTTKEVGHGTGLGLATVYGIVKQHGGFINVYSELGHGTTFRIFLPVAIGAAEKPEPVAADEACNGTETILVAEDHEGLREAAREALTRMGYTVLLARDGEEAVRIFRDARDRIALALMDVVMPRLSGPQAYAQMCALVPGLPAIFVTGYTTEISALGSFPNAHTTLLQKPYDALKLARSVRRVLDGSQRDASHAAPKTS